MQVPKSVSFDRKLEIGAQALCRFDPGCPHHESCAEDPAARRGRER
jgi:hypothetical protein